MSVEQRVHTRYDIDHECEVTRRDVTLEGRMVNVSRGASVDSDALLDALEAGRVLLARIGHSASSWSAASTPAVRRVPTISSSLDA